MANKKYKEVLRPFKWKHSVGEVIIWLVSWYCRYALSYRDLSEMALERGLKLDRSTIYRWVQEYAPEVRKRLKPYLKTTCDSLKLDKTYIKVKGKWHYLYRSIDKNGNTVEWRMIQKGQIRYVGKNLVKQNAFVRNLFGLAA